ncbi:arylalkylamine N-acetyltransferase-like 2 [Ochlerotatus camptorhynchus]|uniref:arylalkylamine N-acetyltransferase-like 2 n=1 Tax=Ochlerotatus camptorhynchus TaxID=644619 RepID=UPI0031D62F0F
MNTVTFEPVLPDGIPDAREFILQYFYPFEPMNRAYINGKEPAQEDVEFTVAYLKQGLGIRAVDGSGRIIGLSLEYIGEESDVHAMLDEAKEQKWADVLQFLAYVQQEANVPEKYEAPYEIQMVAVHPDYQGRSIARELVKRQIELAKRRGFVAVYVDCSSVFTAKIMKKLGFECIHKIALADYRNKEGLQIFQPDNEIHTEMQSFFKTI